MLAEQRKMAGKAMYAMVGAPVVLGRKVKDLSMKMTDNAKDQYEEFAKEGKKVSKEIRERNVVEEISHRVDLEQIQGRVEKLRDQLEGALENWRESFNPSPTKPAPAAKPATRSTAKKAPARKPAARKAPARKPATRSTAKKAPARKPAAKPTATTQK
jgi:cell division septation protein DedD